MIFIDSIPKKDTIIICDRHKREEIDEHMITNSSNPSATHDVCLLLLHPVNKVMSRQRELFNQFNYVVVLEECHPSY